MLHYWKVMKCCVLLQRTFDSLLLSLNLALLLLIVAEMWRIKSAEDLCVQIECNQNPLASIRSSQTRELPGRRPHQEANAETSYYLAERRKAVENQKEKKKKLWSLISKWRLPNGWNIKKAETLFGCNKEIPGSDKLLNLRWGLMNRKKISIGLFQGTKT